MEAPGRAELRAFDVPEIGDDDGLLRVELAGVCGTDLKIWHGSFPVELPLIPGHEICGTIVEIGPAAAERWGVSPGDRVAVDSFLACGHCPACLTGDTRYCASYGDYGIGMPAVLPPHLWGGFSELVYLHPAAQLYPLPPPLTPELGVLVPAVVSNAVRWVGAAGVGIGSSVLICGPGPIGLACVAVARALGARLVLVSGLASDRRRFELAQRLGADETLVADDDLRERVLGSTDGVGVDAVVDVSGSPASVAAAPRVVRRQGTIVVGGVSGGKTSAIDFDDLVQREITIHSVFSHDRAAILSALSFVARSPGLFDEFVTHRYPLAQVPDAIEIVGARDPTLIKSVVEPGR
jgi:alcohol dehydrogenase